MISYIRYKIRKSKSISYMYTRQLCIRTYTYKRGCSLIHTCTYKQVVFGGHIKNKCVYVHTYACKQVQDIVHKCVASDYWYLINNPLIWSLLCFVFTGSRGCDGVHKRDANSGVRRADPRPHPGNLSLPGVRVAPPGM